MTRTLYEYPERIALVGDLLVPAVRHDYGAPVIVDSETNILVHLGDPLLLYDSVCIRADSWQLRLLYSAVTPADLAPLVTSGRIKFFLPIDRSSRAAETQFFDGDYSADRVIANLSKTLQIDEEIGLLEAKPVIAQVEAGLLMPDLTSRPSFVHFYDFMLEKYFEATRDLGYPFTGRDLDVGFEGGMGRTIDAWSSGINGLNLDWEMLFLSEVTSRAFPTIPSAPFVLDSVPVDMVTKLHAMNNIPSVTDLLWAEQVTKEDLIRILMSDESADLRLWMRKNVAPNIDVRDAFYSTLRNLPSKTKWTNRLRFGITSAVSTGLSMLLTGEPLLSTALGLAVGAADAELGEKTTAAVFDKYHPQRWIGYMQRQFQDGQTIPSNENPFKKLIDKLQTKSSAGLSISRPSMLGG